MEVRATRRQLLAGVAGSGVVAMIPQRGLAATPRFPSGVPLIRRTFQNWAESITIPDVPTAIPRHSDDVVAITNWALRAGYRVRATGASHGWSPLVLAGTRTPHRSVVLDTTDGLLGVHVHRGSTPTVTVGAGVRMQDLLTTLEAAGLGINGVPAPGDLTVGGVLAINGHGATTPASGEQVPSGRTFGSLSNLVHSIDAIVWNPRRDRYEERRFQRDEPAARALTVHLGRAMITRATLRVTDNVRLRCQSFTDIPAEELYGAPGAGGRSFSSFLDTSGRAEAIQFPFTDRPWFKTWTVSPHKAAASRETNQPFNYTFSDLIPKEGSDLIRRILSGDSSVTPEFGQVEYAASVAGLAATNAGDLWGWSKNLQLYIKPTTLRVTVNGYAIICRREDVQRVLHDFYRKYTSLMTSYRAAGRYPINGPLEIRMSGLDHATDAGAPASSIPTLSALHPRKDHPEWDTAVWVDVMTVPGTPHADDFYRDLERWMFRHFTGSTMVRTERPSSERTT